MLQTRSAGFLLALFCTAGAILRSCGRQQAAQASVGTRLALSVTQHGTASAAVRMSLTVQTACAMLCLRVCQMLQMLTEFVGLLALVCRADPHTLLLGLASSL